MKDAVIFQSVFHAEQPLFLQDHLIYEQVISPAAAHLSMLLSSSKAVFQRDRIIYKDLNFISPLILDRPRNVQLIIENAKQKSSPFQISSQPVEDELEWTTHCTGELQHENFELEKLSETMLEIQARCPQEMAGTDFYAKFNSVGYHLGKSFQGIEYGWSGENEALNQVQINRETQDHAIYEIHPGAVDAMIQSMLFSSIRHIEKMMQKDRVLIPFSLSEFRCYRLPMEESIWCYSRSKTHEDYLEGDVRVCNESGEILIEMKGLTVRFTNRDTLIKTVQRGPEFYTVEWKPIDPVKQEDQAFEDLYIIFADQGGFGDKLEHYLSEQGAKCIKVLKWQSDESLDSHTIHLNPLSFDDCHRFLKQITHPSVNVLYLWGLDTLSPDEATGEFLEKEQETNMGALLNLTSSVIDLNRKMKIWVITQQAQAVTTEDESVSPSQSTLWGMGRTIAIEHPEFWGGLIDIDKTTSPKMIIRELIANKDEDQIALREDGKFYAPRLRKMSALSDEKMTIHPDSSYLITGGLGALGLLVARWMVNKGAKHLILLGRSQTNPHAQAMIESLTQTGAHIVTLNADVSKAEELFEKLRLTLSDLPALKGVFHCAGRVDDGILIQQNWKRFWKVMSPKVSGAWHLSRFTEEKNLDFFIMFSSISSIFGNQGQGNYAAGNAFLDGLSHYRKHKGLPGISINWGPWDQVGMAVSDDSVRENVLRHGLAYISPEQALNALEKILSCAIPQLAVIDGDWQQYAKQTTQKTAFFSELIEKSSPANEKADSSPVPSLLMEIKGLKQEDRTRRLTQFIQEAAFKIMGGNSGEKPDIDMPLMEQGFDSLMAVELRNHLSQTIDRSLPVTLLFNYPSVQEIVNYLKQELKEIMVSDGEKEEPPVIEKESDEFSYLDELDDDALERLIHEDIGSAEK